MWLTGEIDIPIIRGITLMLNPCGLSAIFRRYGNKVGTHHCARCIANLVSVSTSTLGTSLGTGGMSTKLIAAELATAAGVTTVIMHSEHVKDIFDVIQQPMEGEGGDEGPLCTKFIRREQPINE
jgi:glutamate 5-kinase